MKKMNSLSFPMKWDFLFGRKLLKVALLVVCAFAFVQANAQIIPLPPLVQSEAAAQKLLPEVEALKANPVLVNNLQKDPLFNHLSTKLYYYTHVNEEVLVGTPTPEAVTNRFLEMLSEGTVTFPPGAGGTGLNTTASGSLFLVPGAGSIDSQPISPNDLNHQLLVEITELLKL